MIIKEYSKIKEKIKYLIGDELYKCLKESEAFLAGGAITSLFTNRDINDFDIYFKSKQACKDFLLDNQSTYIKAQTNLALLTSYHGTDIQFIYFKFFDDPQEIFDSFDFTCCMGCFNFKDEKFYFHDDFFKDNCSKELIFNKNTSYPIISALRVNKYIERGYTISKSQMLSIMFTISKLNISTFEEFEKHFGGMYGYKLENFSEEDKNNFNLDNCIDKLIDGSLVEHKGVDKDIFDYTYDWAGYVNALFSDEVYKVKYENEYYYLCKNDHSHNGFDVYKSEFDFLGKIIECEYKDIVKFPLKVYKWVINKNGKLISNYDNSFEYKIGEEAKAINKGYDNLGGDYRWGLYFNLNKDCNDSLIYCGHKCLIECEINEEDIINRDFLFKDVSLRVKKCKVLKVVKEENIIF